MKNEWYNNEISKKLYNDYPHDFSICDIDGICRKFYKENNMWKTRLVIYESKFLNENASQTQMGTLFSLNENINWKAFDKYSGVFLILHNEELTELMIHKIINISQNFKPKYDKKYIKTIDFDSFYEWISVKDIDQDYGFERPK